MVSFNGSENGGEFPSTVVARDGCGHRCVGNCPSSVVVGNGRASGAASSCPDDSLQHLQVKLLSDRAVVPKRGSPQSAGFDLSSAENAVAPAGGRVVVKTDLSIACPTGTYARIAPRR